MIKIQTDFGEFRNIQGQIDKLIGIDKILRTVTNDVVVLITDRVQQRGEKSDGSALKTKSAESFGAYSEAWGKTRKKKGFQTSIMDLTLTGDTNGDFVAEPAGQGAYQVGFRSDKAGKIAKGHEEKHGPIYSPSADEEQFIEDSINNAIDELFK